MQTLRNTELDALQTAWPQHMQRAIQLAASVFSAAPNPRVGCVIVGGNAEAGDSVLGEGWHQGAGLPHAEPVAIANAIRLAAGSTAFVTLEPCCHTGRTGPCSSALIEAGVSRVVIASKDPNPKVSGGGIAALEAAGVEVFFLQDFEDGARRLNRGFFSRLERRRPFVRCKLAMSLDGRTALANGESKWITGAEARSDVQRLRAECDAIVTGIETVLADDPAMTLRQAELGLSAQQLVWNELRLSNPPLRVVLDSRGRLSETAKIVTEPGRCIAYRLDGANSSVEASSPIAVRLAPNSGESVSRVSLLSVLESLAELDECNEVLVEAGATLSGSFIEAGLVDELIVYIAPKLLGSDGRPLLGMSGLNELSDAIEFKVESVEQVGADIKVTLRPR
ncbi:MAG: bifunctional diaminohydroxyphosphoribosylaminopyrimidine deaminase/5-amino-6-(5-phosphoribosylamino)uracil reductase RibD [Gammaproteobacteria bacterium]|jgi:diaminohydroxyphosphoribosylaminopyrimidine deaminase/5-amino-6-(5-phosphoribosylamino)uracil reductase|nr:bifunctional diaminohydroxyphosphoribosylaminopyrimidine deaminase/5-amino-6-(5-phosphoribosylamino)uracil reductase RibD [Gammaproteobacteria bacterium]MDG1514369.1 bifunctional diaminohydroxyphosphoribosylaminopyrimidine deaminase/5-amino-6-(5-phosphoribosylamino)uracil reductase RibD [Gammaproteobacteria bacterium]MDG1795348.1 bifunctional diaminohydroxyphosphoribosylaminopyrimidine deaminase/5-amino-6-(5-phosphoribosylamino)uracil reductase RibD [Gammaproteobacteria bacterium]